MSGRLAGTSLGVARPSEVAVGPDGDLSRILGRHEASGDGGRLVRQLGVVDEHPGLSVDQHGSGIEVQRTYKDRSFIDYVQLGVEPEIPTALCGSVSQSGLTAASVRSS